METAYIAIGAALVYAACAAAAVGAFLPVLPGPLLSFAAILAFKLALPESQLGWWNVGICGALAAFAQAADIFMSWMGAKKFGATWRGGSGLRASGRAGLGAFAGSLAASMLKFLIVVYMAFAFSAGVFGLF